MPEGVVQMFYNPFYVFRFIDCERVWARRHI